MKGWNAHADDTGAEAAAVHQEFFLLNLAPGDVERLVRFELLGDAGLQGKRARAPNGAKAKVNWAELEKRVGTSDKAFQRPIIRKKIDALAEYYTTCREQQLLPAIQRGGEPSECLATESNSPSSSVVMNQAEPLHEQSTAPI